MLFKTLASSGIEYKPADFKARSQTTKVCLILSSNKASIRGLVKVHTKSSSIEISVSRCFIKSILALSHANLNFANLFSEIVA